jgi:hypothetical protein
MTTATSTLRPGLLVSLKTSIRGNVQYVRRDMKVEKKVLKNGEEHAKWETERTIANKAEHERACQTRSLCRMAITRPCASSAFGLLCPEALADELEQGIAESNRLVDEFNATAELTRLSVYVMKGKIAQDDVEAVKAINSEVRELLQTMEEGLKNLDAKSVREAASKAKNIGSMLAPDAEAKVRIAIDAARASATAIAKAGEQASLVVDTITIKKIAEQRTAFLDMGEAQEIATPRAKARAVDFAPEVVEQLTKADAARGKTYKPRRKIERDIKPVNRSSMFDRE